MKRKWTICFELILVLAIFLACKTPDQHAETKDEPMVNENDSTGGRIIITVGSRKFLATLARNATATAFKARLPLKVQMVELNGNEKYYRFSEDLPGKGVNPGRIEAGDLLLYSANTLVLFYESFNTSYQYTRIGRIDDPSGLKAALGSGTVSVSFTLHQNSNK